MRVITQFAFVGFIIVVLFSLILATYAQDYGTGAFQEDEGVNLPSLPPAPSATAQQGQASQVETGDVSVTVRLDNKPAVGAQVKLSCYGINSNIQLTDAFGTAVFHFVPVGNCQVMAGYQQSSDTKRIDVAKGQMNTVELNFQSQNQITGAQTAQTQIDSERPSLLRFFGSIFLLALAIFGLLMSYKFVRSMARKMKKPEQITVVVQNEVKTKPQVAQKVEIEQSPTNIVAQKEELSERTKDIIETLDDKERIIVKFLLENDHSCSQGKIHHETNITRTTLHRVVDSLARKKILNVEKHGKARYVTLTDWFLGKEE